ncbi:hypothetical protein [Prosthecobacter fusiformis]|uniref:hypothetical protein n=1 Tax=Prosthecobacter fusiformis TaxID=48464 RepID=UPI00105DBF5D|nr:hypothetical protein [Prosthecobacter fusiformis]
MNTYDFILQGQDWALIERGSPEPTKVYIDTPKMAALAMVAKYLHGAGAVLRIYKRNGSLDGVREYPAAAPRPQKSFGRDLRRALA